MTEELQDQPAPEENLDLPLEFREVATKYGRPMFTVVFNAGMSSQAAQVLVNFAQKHRSQHSIHAIGVLTRSFNEISNAYCKQMGWEEGMLAQCDRDIGLAFRNKLVVPGSSIILDS